MACARGSPAEGNAPGEGLGLTESFLETFLGQPGQSVLWVCCVGCDAGDAPRVGAPAVAYWFNMAREAELK